MLICVDCQERMILANNSHVVFLNHDNENEKVMTCIILTCPTCHKKNADYAFGRILSERKQDPTIDNLVKTMELRGQIAAKIKK